MFFEPPVRALEPGPHSGLGLALGWPSGLGVDLLPQLRYQLRTGFGLGLRSGLGVGVELGLGSGSGFGLG